MTKIAVAQVAYTAGELILKEGSKSDHRLHLVCSGAVLVVKEDGINTTNLSKQEARVACLAEGVLAARGDSEAEASLQKLVTEA